MTQRRGTRSSQVRPRPPSTGRPAPATRPRPSSPRRAIPHRRVERGPGIPIPVRALLVLLVVALGAVILYSATGQIGKVLAGFGTAVSQAIDGFGNGPSPRPSAGPIAPAPSLDTPSSAYTNQATVDITGTVPLSVLGSDEYTISLYQQLQGQEPALIREQVAIPQTANFTIPGVKLIKGANVFVAAIDGPGGESPRSRPITYVLDTAKPRLTIVSPKNGAKVNGTSVNITGRTQARSEVLALNTTNHASTTATADNNGAFTVAVPISLGTNLITITVTDPASNASSLSITLNRGTGKLSMGLVPNRFSFSAKTGATLRFTATLLDPDGKPIANQLVVFTISIAGIPADVKMAKTDSSGRATVTVSIGPGAANSGRNHTGPVIATADTPQGHVQKSIVISTEK
jgi:Glucodextranase, domain B